MGRYAKWSEERIAQLEKEGYGKGVGEHYKPWIEVWDFSSIGDSYRISSRLTNRTHHFVSSIERDFFLLAEFSPDVIDIREQFPLPRPDTLSIAATLGVQHPLYENTTIATVMTTDFVITRERNGNRWFEAYDCKPASAASDARSIEKLEIQRRLFDSDGIPHRLVFDTKLPANKCANLYWVHKALLAEGEIEPYPGYFEEHCQRLLHDIQNAKQQLSLTDYCTQYDRRTSANTGTGLRVARMLIKQRKLTTDLNQADLASLPIAMFSAVLPGKLKVAGA